MLVPCVRCNGEPLKDQTCGACDGTGWHEIAHCPGKLVDAATWRAIDLFDDARKGMLPVSGGVLDQCYAWVTARRWFEREDAMVKAELAGKV